MHGIQNSLEEFIEFSMVKSNVLPCRFFYFKHKKEYITFGGGYVSGL